MFFRGHPDRRFPVTPVTVALILGGSAENRALPVVLAALARNTVVSWGLLNSGIFLAALPTLFLVVVVWRLVIEGIIVKSVRR